MGEGIHATMEFKDTTGAYARRKTDVTYQPNKVFTKK